MSGATGNKDIFQTVPPLHEVLEQLSPIDSQWQEIDQALELSQNFLTGLAQSSKSNKIKLCALLQQWLETQYICEDAVTWEVAIAAVESGIVGKKAIADKMRQYLIDYNTPKLQDGCSSLPDTFKAVPSLYDLSNHLSSINSQWFEIGLALKLSYNFLTGLAQSSGSNMVKLSHVLNKWLESQYISEEKTTWEVAIAAIESDIVGSKSTGHRMKTYLSELHLQPTQDSPAASSPDTCRSAETLKLSKLIRLLHSINLKWFELGLALKLEFHVLEEIAANSCSNINMMREVLQRWLTDYTNVSWEFLIAALESDIVDSKNVAHKIRLYLNENETQSSSTKST